MAVKKATKKVVKKAPVKKATKRGAVGNGVNPLSAYGQALARRTEENLSDIMKRRRDVFIREYVRDFNGAQAWLRMKAEVEPQDAHKAYSAAQAAEYAYQLRNEPYVAKRIAELIDSMEEVDMLSAKRVLAMVIRDAELQGIGAKHAARVGAQKLLMDYLNMTSSAKAVTQRIAPPGGAGGPRGGVMLVPEQAGSADSWEARAAKVQAQLKEDVRK